ncbi:MAG: hypothetical protein Q4G13_04220 [Moraxella sp.]|nr:hypothetical protein [Moraxella sp.]
MPNLAKSSKWVQLSTNRIKSAGLSGLANIELRTVGWVSPANNSQNPLLQALWWFIATVLFL